MSYYFLKSYYSKDEDIEMNLFCFQSLCIALTEQKLREKK